MRISKLVKGIVIGAAIVLIGVLIVWHFRFAPHLLWNVTYELHLLPLSESVMDFSKRYKRLPTSVE